MPAKPTAFLSLNRDSARPIAQTIHDELNTRGADVFYDFDVPRGQNWQLILPQERSRRDYHLVVLTPATVGSIGVRDEITLSLQQGKSIIPIMAAGFDFGLPNLPPEIAALGSYMGVYYDTSDPNPSIEELAAALGLENPPQTTAQSVTLEKSVSNKQGMSTEVKVAIIVGIFGLITTIVTGFFGLAPSLIPLFLRSDPTPTATFTLSPTIAITDTHTPTPIPPTDTPTLTPTTPTPTDRATVAPTDTETPAPTNTPTATNTATSAPSMNDIPTQVPTASIALTTSTLATQSYPCEGQIISRSSALLNVVRANPSLSAPLRDPIQQGLTVVILARAEERRHEVWYQIANASGDTLGWILPEYVIPSVACPT